MGDYFVDNDLNGFNGDERLLELLKYNRSGEFRCVYCMGKADSREHIPSMIFLDNPYPSQLAILPSCVSCNNSFSADEQYLACLIDYVQFIFERMDRVKRNKVEKTIHSRPHFERMLNESTFYKENGVVDYINFDKKKVDRIVYKLAKGHAAYTLSEVFLEEPTILIYKFLPQLSQDEINNFNSPVLIDVMPEIGSRALRNLVMFEGKPIETWKIVQENQYRFLAYIEPGGLRVRFVIGEYFFAEVIWSD